MIAEFNEDTDIDIIFNTEDGIGFGYIYKSDEDFVSVVFTSRLNQDLLDKRGTYQEITEVITKGEAFVKDHCNLEGALIEVLDFYFLTNVDDLWEIERVDTIHEAIERLLSSTENYFIFQMR